VIDGTSAQHRERPAKERREMATAEAPDAVPSTERMTIPIRRRTGRLPEKKAPGRSTMTERTRMRLLKGGKRRVV
jgi:hypothetical protein